MLVSCGSSKRSTTVRLVRIRSASIDFVKRRVCILSRTAAATAFFLGP